MKKRVLLCVLDWGLGHATRSLALLRRLEHHGHEVLVASSGRALALLAIECPNQGIFELPSYNVHYASSGFEVGMLKQVPKIMKAIRTEHGVVSEIVAREKVDAIISDNRYGCWHKSARSIFLSHNLMIRLNLFRMLSGPVNRYHKRLVGRFDECWVPDFPDHRLSGELSRASWPKIKFIGPLTTMHQRPASAMAKYDVLAIVSGPEPQRTIFGELLTKELDRLDGNHLVVHGRPGRREDLSPHAVSFMTRKELNEAIIESKVVISRPGYSTIMDLCAVGGSAIFVPTPGQTEQQYLAEQLDQAGVAHCQSQDRLNIREALAANIRYKGFQVEGQQPELLGQAIETSITNLK